MAFIDERIVAAPHIHREARLDREVRVVAIDQLVQLSVRPAFRCSLPRRAELLILATVVGPQIDAIPNNMHAGLSCEPRRSARQLHFTPSALRDLAVGGLLHDIGKLSIPREILQKPGKLTDDEYLQIQRHPELGVQILTQLGGFSVGVATLVADHHERLDGSGYPHRLAGRNLSDAARILGVCDVYEALIFDARLSAHLD